MGDERKQYRCVQECFFRGRRWRPGDGKILTLQHDELDPPHFKRLGVDKREDVEEGYNENEILHAKIREALQQLNPNDPSHWTARGEPAVIAVEAVLGFDIYRRDIDEAWPGFNQDTMTLSSAKNESLLR